MARRELGAAGLRVAQAVEAALPGGSCIVGCSGGADSLALTLATQWAARRAGTHFRAIVVDHGIQEGSAARAGEVAGCLRERGVAADVVRVEVRARGEGLEAAARSARLDALAQPGLPVLLGHTLDDQAETVLLGLLRGSGARSLSGMASRRGPFIRPLLAVRRDDTRAACQEWGVQPWEDPMNEDRAFARVRARDLLRDLGEELDRDVAPALARTAQLLRADADLLDELAAQACPDPCRIPVAVAAALPEALRGRVVHRFLTEHGVEATQRLVSAVDGLLTRWRGQGPVSVPGGEVSRSRGWLCFDAARFPGR